MYIVSGQYKGRKIHLPEGQNTRPTLTRVRQILFDILSHSDLLPNWDQVMMADIFAGSGSIGLEALSRGAKAVTFFEQNPAAQSVLKQNIQSLSAFAQIFDDALQPQQHDQAMDLLFFDPPYHQASDLKGVIHKFQETGWCNENSLIVAQMPIEVEPCFTTMRSKKIGVTRLDFIRIAKI